MALSVSMPVRLRLDPRTAAPGGHEVLEAAVQRACARAAKTAAEELKDRGDYLSLTLSTPTFCWRGAMGRLDPAHRAALEAIVAGAIRAGVEPELHRPADTAAPEPLRDGEGAVPDADRMVPGSYLAPSYDTASGAHPDEIVFAVEPREFQMAYPRGYVGLFYRFTTKRALDEAFRNTIRSLLARPASVGRVSAPEGRIGCLFLKDHTFWIGLADFNGDVDTLTVDRMFSLGNVDVFHVDENDHGKAQPSPVSLTGVGQIESAAPGQDVAAAMRDHFDAFIEGVIEEKRQTARGKLRDADAATLRRNLGAVIHPRVEAAIADAKKRNGGASLTFARFTDGSGGVAYGAVPDVIGSGRPIKLYPIVYAHWDPRLLEDGEGGGGGGTGARGKGKGGPKGSGSGTGDGVGDGDASGEAKARAGGGSEEGEAEGTSARFVFPSGPGGEPVEIDLGPLNGELSFDDLGPVGERLREMMRRVAFRLSMPEGKYPGSFLVGAAKMWGARASNASGFEGVRAATMTGVMPKADQSPMVAYTGMSAAGVAATLSPVFRRVSGGGSLGDVDFEPADSPVLRTIRHLGGTVPMMTAMSNLLFDAYRDKANAARLGSYYTGDGVSWHLHFLHEYSPAMRDSIAFGFKVACKSILIQLCLSSRHEILLRVNNFDRYAQLVETMLVQMMAPQAELQLLRKTLTAWLNENRRTVASTVASGYATWREARQALTAAIGEEQSTTLLYDSRTKAGQAKVEARVELGTDDVPRVRDPRGRRWTMEELEQAIALGTGTAEAIDPLIRKITDLPQAAMMAQARPDMLKSYLRALLAEMLDGNTKITAEAEGPAEFAFRASKIQEDIAKADVPGTTVVLGGLHLLAHQAIGASFLGDSRYAEGLDRAFSAELGRQGINQFFEFTGMLLLSVVCPPLGAAAQAGMAAIHLHDAHERMDMLKGLMDADKVYALADAELDLFMAELEGAFSFIPLAGKAAKWGAKGTVAVVRQGVKAGSKQIARGIAKEVAEEIADQLKHGLIVAFVKEIATDQVMGQVVEAAIRPAMEALVKEIELTVGGGNTSGADGAIARTNIERLLNEEGDSDKARSEGAERARKGTF